MNIGQLANHLILNSTKSNKEILEIILQQFPEAKTSMSCIAWYKSDLRKKGLIEGSKGKNSVVLSEEQLAALCE